MRKRLPVMMVLLCLSGCGGLSTVPLPGGVAYSDDGQYLPPPVGPGLVANPDSAVPDVPAPIGFKPLVGRSHASSNGVTRDVKAWYQGQANQAEAQIFYRQQLPEHGWQFEDQQTAADGATVLHYTKGLESLRVRLSQTHAVTTIVLTIQAKQPTAPAMP